MSTFSEQLMPGRGGVCCPEPADVYDTGCAAHSTTVPERTAADQTVVILLFLLSAAYLWLFRRYTAMDPDEGIVLEGAQRILRGQVLYRDFFSFYTPGSYYFAAILFKIFGNSIIVARSLLAFVGGAFSVIAYLLARRVCSRWSSILAVVLMTLTTLPFRFLVLHNWDSTLWACLALYCAVRWQETAGWNWAFATGSLLSITFLFEQSKGAGLVLGISLGILAISLLGPRQNLFTRAQLSAMAVGLFWPFTVTLIYFGIMHTLLLMLADWLWPLQHYSAANHVPYGYQNWSDNAREILFGSCPWSLRTIKILVISPCFLVPALPLLALGFLVYCVVQMRHRASKESHFAYYALINASIGGLLLSVIIVRADIVHFMYLEPVFCLVLAWILDARDIPGRIIKSIGPLLTVCITIAFIALAMPLLLKAGAPRNEAVTRHGTITTPETDGVIDYVQAHVPVGNTMFVYPYLPLYYYLSGTLNPTRYEYFQPGMNTRQQAEEIITQLASQHVRTVLFEPSFTDKIPTSWPATPISAIVSDPVADYILREYHTCKILTSTNSRQFFFMIRKDFACP